MIGFAIILLCNTTEISLDIWDIVIRPVWKGCVAVTPEDGTDNVPKHAVCTLNI
jgi:hypothetical protein